MTVRGKPLVGVTVVLQAARTDGTATGRFIARDATDAEGRFGFSGIPAGNYAVTALTFLYVLPGSWDIGIPVSLSDGETLTGIDLALVCGGVITGRVTDHQMRPLIEQHVQPDRLDQNDNPTPRGSLVTRGEMLKTDDRGIYRIYGVPPGRYRISAGQGAAGVYEQDGRRSYPRTFHPDVRNEREARIIEVVEGGTIPEIDIKLGAPIRTYAVVGRTIDAETGTPIEGMPVSCDVLMSNGRSGGELRAVQTGPGGEFRLEGLSGGVYRIQAGRSQVIVPAQDANTGGLNHSGYSEPAQIEVIDRDVGGVELKVRRGGSISGAVVIEGADMAAVPSLLPQGRFLLYLLGRESAGSELRTLQVRPGPDGRFRIDGLRPGKIMIGPINIRFDAGRLTLARIERDGAALPAAVDLEPGGEIGGLRLTFLFGNLMVRGQVRIINGELPKESYVLVSAVRKESGTLPVSAGFVRVDSSGRFVLDGLAPGRYEITARLEFSGARPPEYRSGSPMGAQLLTVAESQTPNISLTIDLARPGAHQ